MSPIEDQEHFVYRLFDVTGQLLYVGCTANPKVRIGQHRSLQPWWHEVDESKTLVEKYVGKRRACAAERLAVRHTAPRYNRRLVPRSTAEVSNERRFHSTPEVAAIVGMNYEALKKLLVRRPELQPERKLGRSWFWTAEEIERLKEKQ